MPNTDFDSIYGDIRAASNFLEQYAFGADRLVIEAYPDGPLGLPRILIRVGHFYEPATARDLAILDELEEEFGPARRFNSDAILELPAGQLHIMGAHLPRDEADSEPVGPDREPTQLELPLDITVGNGTHPVFDGILRGWRGGE